MSSQRVCVGAPIGRAVLPRREYLSPPSSSRIQCTVAAPALYEYAFRLNRSNIVVSSSPTLARGVDERGSFRISQRTEQSTLKLFALLRRRARHAQYTWSHCDMYAEPESKGHQHALHASIAPLARDFRTVSSPGNEPTNAGSRESPAFTASRERR